MLNVVNVKDLQDQGYLVKLTYKDLSLVSHEELPTNKSRSEFDIEKFEEKVVGRYTYISNFITDLPHHRKLVFCSSIEMANDLQGRIPGSQVVTSETTKKNRENIIADFRAGKFEILLGVNIFAIGFNVPEIDCIVLLRPTRSLRLHSQVLGRGTRVAPGKETCRVYDLVGNIRSLGTLESMEIKKIEEKWNVVTSSKPDGFHMVPLFEFRLPPKTTVEEPGPSL